MESAEANTEQEARGEFVALMTSKPDFSRDGSYVWLLSSDRVYK